MMIETTPLIDDPSINSYKKYPYRFVIPVIYTVLCYSTVLLFTIFMPLNSQISSMFNISLSEATFCTLIVSNITYTPSTFLANYIIDKVKMKKALIIGGLLNVCGLWLRLLAPSSFYWILAGQCIGGLSQAFFYATPPKISAIWYPPNERPMSTTVMVSLMTLGSGVGAFIPQWFVDPNAENDVAMGQIMNMFWFFAIEGSAVLVLGSFLLKDEPPSPPSKSAAASRFGFAESLKQLCMNKNYMIALISQSILNGSLVNVLMVTQPLLAPFGYGQDYAGNVLFIGIGISTGLSLFLAWILARTHKYKLTLIVCAFIGVAGLVGATIWAYLGISFGLVVMLLVFMSIQNASLPACDEFVVEISYPVAEEAAAGLVFLLFQLIASAITFLCDWILTVQTKKNSLMALFVIVGIYVFGLLMFCFAKEDLKRKTFEHRKHT